MNRDVSPRATPVSTTLAGRKLRVRHHMARTSPVSPSFHGPKLCGPIRSPDAVRDPMILGTERLESPYPKIGRIGRDGTYHTSRQADDVLERMAHFDAVPSRVKGVEGRDAVP